MTNRQQFHSRLRYASLKTAEFKETQPFAKLKIGQWQWPFEQASQTQGWAALLFVQLTAEKVVDRQTGRVVAETVVGWSNTG